MDRLFYLSGERLVINHTLLWTGTDDGALEGDSKRTNTGPEMVYVTRSRLMPLSRDGWLSSLR